MNSDFSYKLLQLRNSKNWTQEQLAEKCGVSRQAVAKWENGQCIPDLFKIAQLSDLFDVSILDLIPNNKKSNDINSCLIAIGKVFPLCFFANLTTNRYRMMNYEDWNSNDFKETGTFDEILQTGVFTVPDRIERFEFSKSFTRANLIKLYHQGRKTVSLKHKQTWTDNSVHWVETTVYFAENRVNDDVLCAVFGKIIDDEIEIQKQILAREKIIQTLTSDYSSTFLTNIDTGEIIYTLLDEKLLSTITNKNERTTNCYDPKLEAFFKENIHPDDYENYINSLKKETIIEHFKTQNAFSFTYRMLINDEYKYHITTIKKCDDYDVTHNYILAIRCIDSFLKQNNEMVEKKNDILKNVSHKIRNPLNVVMGMLRLLQQTENTELQNEFLQVAINSGNELTQALNSFFNQTINEVIKKDAGLTDVVDKSIEQLKNKRALLVDDVMVNNLIVQELLKNIGITSSIATNGEEAVNLLYDNPSGFYDFIIMDVGMPVLNGLEATKRIRKMKDKQKSSIPIIGLSAFDTDDDIQKAKKCGMNYYLLKPLNPTDLFNIILKIFFR